MNRIFFIFTILILLSGCEKFDLPRDNPLDNSGNEQPTPPNNNDIEIIYERNSIYWDNNNDGIINIGETIKLRVYLKNIGSNTASNIKAKINTNNDKVQMYYTNFNTYYNYISPNQEVYGKMNNNADFSVQFKVLTSFTGNNIKFTIDIFDDNSNHWADDFSVSVE